MAFTRSDARGLRPTDTELRHHESGGHTADASSFSRCLSLSGVSRAGFERRRGRVQVVEMTRLCNYTANSTAGSGTPLRGALPASRIDRGRWTESDPKLGPLSVLTICNTYRAKLKRRRPRESESADELLNVRIPLQVTQSDRKSFENAARTAGVPLSRWIRQTLREAAGR